MPQLVSLMREKSTWVTREWEIVDCDFEKSMYKSSEQGNSESTIPGFIGNKTTTIGNKGRLARGLMLESSNVTVVASLSTRQVTSR
jgi:hypothetical protein